MPDSTILSKKATQLFKDGFYCSEAIIQVFNEHLDLGLNEMLSGWPPVLAPGWGQQNAAAGRLPER